MLPILSLALLASLPSETNSFSLSPLGSSRRPLSVLSMAAEKKKLLIIQNKGGGHGEIGYQLCKTILSSDAPMDITILQDKCNYKKPPFSSYKGLEEQGVKVVETKLTGSESSPSESAALLSGSSFDYIVDNWSKNTGNATFAVEIAKSSKAQQLVFISSAGMYKSSGKLPHEEGDPVKENDARKVELTVAASSVPYTFLRPQYIYGPNANKRYLDFFIGRAFRKLPIPLPMSGEQLVCLTHIEDVSSLIASTLGAEKAIGQVFNCGTDRYITYKGLADLIHTTYGNDLATDASYLYYDPKDFEHWDGSGVMEFPFRRETFITTPSKAKLLLGWKPKHSIVEAIKDEVSLYESLGGTAETWGVDQLRYDLEVIASKDNTFMFNYPFLEK